MANPKSFESSVQQFYQSIDGGYDKSIKSWMDDGSKNIKKQSRPQTAIIDDYISAEVSTKLTESIRNDMDVNASEDPFGSFFQDLSGWDMEKKTESLNDASSLTYLNYAHKKDDNFTDSGSYQSLLKKKKSRKVLEIRALLASAKKPSTASNIGYRSTNEWGSEEDSNSRPYALDIPGSSQQVCEEDESIHSKEVSNQDIHVKPLTADNHESRNLDQELNTLIEATKSQQKVVTKPPSSRCVRRAVSGNDRSIFHGRTFSKSSAGKRTQKISVTGQKYHNSDISQSQDKLFDRPFSAVRSTLPKISNQTKKTFPVVKQQDFKKELIVQNNAPFEKKDAGIEIPKWYNDSGTKPTHDQNLIRYMEIMGSKSSLRSPRKLSSSGFLSLPMPNQPPETRGFVFDKKPTSISLVLNEMIQEDQGLKVDILKVPIRNSNQRSFAEEVQLNREAKSKRKIKQ